MFTHPKGGDSEKIVGLGEGSKIFTTKGGGGGGAPKKLNR